MMREMNLTTSKVIYIKHLEKRLKHISKSLDEQITENINLEYKIEKLNEDILELKEKHKNEVKMLQVQLDNLTSEEYLTKCYFEMLDKKEKLEKEADAVKIKEYDKKYENSNCFDLLKGGIFDD